jgi:hypothetical protein
MSKVFISYAWDTAEHQGWVRDIATRLVGDGVDVVLDIWDTRLGGDLALFMEQGIDTAQFVLVVCSDSYLLKSQAPEGGVGYEKRILTRKLMADLESDALIPILRTNTAARGRELPSFMGTPKYVDFRDEANQQDSYRDLLFRLHGRQVEERPTLGRSPFDMMPAGEVPGFLRADPAQFRSTSLAARCLFDYTSNSGNYEIGSGDSVFTLAFYNAGPGVIHAVNDPKNIKCIAMATGVADARALKPLSSYDWSSRVRSVRVGDMLLLENTFGRVAAVAVEAVETRDSSSDGKHRISFTYEIQPIPYREFDGAKALSMWGEISID